MTTERTDAPRQVPFRAGGFSTLAEALDYAALSGNSLTFHDGRGNIAHEMTYADMARRAKAMAGRLLEKGLMRGSRVALMATTEPEFFIAFFACQYAGLVACPVPYMTRLGMRDEYVENVARMMRTAGVAVALASPDYIKAIREAAQKADVPMVLAYDELAGQPRGAPALQPLGADETAYIQFSSGSTSAPKGIVISQQAICANTTSILRDGFHAQAADRGFSWLPLYHDMGLVGSFLSPLVGQHSMHYMAPHDFSRRPWLWTRLISRHRCTISFGSSFAYELLVKQAERAKREELDLSCWRIAGIGGDMVRPEVLLAFTDKFADTGFRREAFMPSYGMAEMTLAVSMHAPEEDIVLDVVERDSYKTMRRAVPAKSDGDEKSVRTFIACGRPLPGTDVRIVDDQGRPLGEREIGHIEVKSPSLMDGYFKNPDATEIAMSEDGFLKTGDMGYWLDGQLVITGRVKDLILYHGRNIWAHDIEWTAEKVEGVRTGLVAAFGVENLDGQERVVVLVEARSRDRAENVRLCEEVKSRVHHAIGVPCEVYLVSRNTLAYTYSGKLARSKVREAFEKGEINLVDLP